MQANYGYVIDKLGEYASRPEISVLDYGCGKGEVVQLGRQLGYQAYGVEKFYGGSDIRDIVASKGLLGDLVRELGQDGRIPFGDGTFDVVVSNQVFEHVPDLQDAIAEISRVLKQGGVLLFLCPTMGTIREVHCGVPFVHWLPKSTRVRYYWLLFWRTFGLGSHKDGKSRREWAADFHTWLNDYTHYRSRGSIERILALHFSEFSPLEDDYLGFRLRLRRLDAAARVSHWPVIRVFSRAAVRMYGGVVMSVRKHDITATERHN